MITEVKLCSNRWDGRWVGFKELAAHPYTITTHPYIRKTNDTLLKDAAKGKQLENDTILRCRCNSHSTQEKMEHYIG
jgi:hypothetical protein